MGLPVLFGLLVLPCVVACSDGDGKDAEEDGGGLGGAGASGTSAPSLSWFSSSCAELGGTTTATGACYIPCKTDADCPTEELRCGTNSVWTYFACELRPELRAQGCGQGWFDDGYTCKLECFGQSTDCPSGWSCAENIMGPADYFCTGYVSGGGGTPGCPDWCGYPYCDGACAGCC